MTVGEYLLFNFSSFNVIIADLCGLNGITVIFFIELYKVY